VALSQSPSKKDIESGNNEQENGEKHQKVELPSVKNWLKAYGLAADGKGSQTMACLLSLVAGWLSAVGYIVLFKLYVGPMSGNSISFASELMEGDILEALSRLYALFIFCIGTLLGSLLREIGLLNKWKRITAIFFSTELFLIFLFFWGLLFIPEEKRDFTHYGFWVLTVPAVGALAFQITALQKVGTMPMSSTVVTSSLARACEGLAKHFLANWKYKKLKNKLLYHSHENLNQSLQSNNLLNQNEDEKHLEELKNQLTEHKWTSFFYWMMWISYTIGAMFGAVLYTYAAFKMYSLVPIMMILLVLILSDLKAQL